MTYKLRSLSGVLAFDAAARHESLTLAAKELGRTQSAVSQQVKLLEEQTGLKLFVRRPRKVVLTPDGKVLAEAMRQSLAAIEQTIGQLQQVPDKHTLRLTMTHSFAMKWLSPRLLKFNRRYPQYDVRFEADDRLVDLEAEGVDFAIRHGDENSNYKKRDAGYVSTVLWEELYVAVYAPCLSESGVVEAKDVAKYPLLSWVTTNLWSRWLVENGVSATNLDIGKTYGHAALMVQSAIAGAGVAIVPVTVAHDAIMAGDLKVVNAKVLRDTYMHRAVYPDLDEMPEKVAAFYSWLKEEIALMQQEAKAYLIE